MFICLPVVHYFRVSWFYRHCIRPILFKQDAERAHEFALKTLSRVSQNSAACAATGALLSAPPIPTEVFGLKFPNPIGLAAGMDKFAAALPVWERMGFGFCELGGVTRHAQPGNPSPRMFRAPAAGAIINRMGFNNPGAEAFGQTLAGWKNSKRWPKHPVGINLGKSKITPLDKAAEDYASSFRLLRDYADFFVINVSSPNTPGLRQLQDKSALDEILAAVCELQKPGNRPAVLVKVAPDLTFEALDEILDLASARNLSGIVATNTTLARPESNDPGLRGVYSESGGLSGRPLRDHSTEMIRHIFKTTGGRLPIIGVGGIFSANDSWQKISAGASLLQIYTGLVYEGPGLAKQIVAGLLQRMESEGVRELKEIVGRE
ncbi:MAG TPA: quinone-dependent dihydroorotate dehydrogenase [Candidatus Acidoferrales bacterium]|jgi:dihydroorotate dehydrogenase|nr:quinone-dependent dihydroorotate dehydrogenase [Candidatus Acidoferrales bacterium]